MKWIKNNWKIIIIGILSLLMGFYAYKYQNLIIDYGDLDNITKVRADSIKHLKDKNGRHVVQIESFEIEKQENFLKIQFQDSLIQELQQTVKDYKKKNLQFAAIIKSYAEIDTTAKVEYIITEVPTQPIYKWSLDTEWYKIIGVTNHLTSDIHLKFWDSKSIVTYVKKNKIITEVTDHNPYSSTYGLRSYTNKAPKIKKFGLGPNVGWSPWNGFYIGIGVNYNLIELW